MMFEEPIATSNKLYNRILSFTESICNISELVFQNAHEGYSHWLLGWVFIGYAHVDDWPGALC